jgi:hypothetical protein
MIVFPNPISPSAFLALFFFLPLFFMLLGQIIRITLGTIKGRR